MLSKGNLGTGSGYNIGIKFSKTDYVYVINPDITLAEDALEEIFVASKKFFRIGWCKELTSLTGILLKIAEWSFGEICFSISLKDSLIDEQDQISFVFWEVLFTFLVWELCESNAVVAWIPFEKCGSPWFKGVCRIPSAKDEYPDFGGTRLVG